MIKTNIEFVQIMGRYHIVVEFLQRNTCIWRPIKKTIMIQSSQKSFIGIRQKWTELRDFSLYIL